MDKTNPLELSTSRPDGRPFFAENPDHQIESVLQIANTDYRDRVGVLEKRRIEAFVWENREQLEEVDRAAMALEAEHASRLREIKTGGLVIKSSLDEEF